MTNPTSSEAPCSVTAEEFPVLLCFLNRIFGPHVQPGIEVLYPTFFRPTTEALENLRVVHADGKIVSHTGVQVQELAVGEATLKSGFVGAVATDPNYRGRGYASLLLTDAVRRMRDEGFDLSTLGGFRDYYARFGWELGGREYSFMMFQRCIPSEMKVSCNQWTHAGADDHVCRQAGDATKIMTTHEKEALRVRRSMADGCLLLDVPGRKTFCARAGDRFAYVVVGPGRWSVHGDWKQAAVIDFGGPADLIVSLLNDLFANHGYGLLWVYTPASPHPAGASPHPLRDILLRIAQEMYLGAMLNLRVINLDQLLRKLQPVMTQRLRAQPAVVAGAVSIEVRDPILGNSRVALAIETDGVAVTNPRGDQFIEMDSLQLVNLLFGRDRPSCWCPWLDRNAARLLDQVFPLDLYAFQMDHV